MIKKQYICDNIMNIKPTSRDYCQFLVSTQVNYTQTYFADHHRTFSHDAVNRYLQDADLSPADVWKLVKNHIEYADDACLIFDDSVLDKNHSRYIELVRKQYSGNAHGLIKGIGVVNCLYVNLKTGHYWIIDWRIFNPDEDGKTKLDHMKEIRTYANYIFIINTSIFEITCHRESCRPSMRDLHKARVLTE